MDAEHRLYNGGEDENKCVLAVSKMKQELEYKLASLDLKLKLLDVVGCTTPVSKPVSFHHTQK